MIWHEIPIVILEFLLFIAWFWGFAPQHLWHANNIRYNSIEKCLQDALVRSFIGVFSIAAKLEIPAYFVTSALINCKQFSYKLNAFNPLSTCYIVSSQSVSQFSLSGISATSIPCGPDLIDRDECNFIIYFYVYCQLIIHNQVGIFSPHLLFYSSSSSFRLVDAHYIHSGLALNMIKNRDAIAIYCRRIQLQRDFRYNFIMINNSGYNDRLIPDQKR